MDMSRRSFLRGVLVITAMAVSPVALSRIPTIYGNGVDDDAEGLQALFDGNPFHVEAEDVRAADGILRGGTFSISRGLIIRRDDFRIENCTIRTRPEYADQYMLNVEKCSNIAIVNNFLDTRASQPNFEPRYLELDELPRDIQAALITQRANARWAMGDHSLPETYREFATRYRFDDDDHRRFTELKRGA